MPSPKGPEAEYPVAPMASADEILANSNPQRVPFKDRKDEEDLRQSQEEHELRKTVAKWAYRAVALQIGIADIVFITYAWAGRDWDVPTTAIAAWLSATVVQAIGVALVITRFLFPRRPHRQ